MAKKTTGNPFAGGNLVKRTKKAAPAMPMQGGMMASKPSKPPKGKKSC